MLRIRMTQDDREILEAAAASNDLDISAWARGVLLRSAKRRATITVEWTTKNIQRGPESGTK